MAVTPSKFALYPIRTSRNLWRTNRTLVLVVACFFLFLFVLNPFGHSAGPHLPKDYELPEQDPNPIHNAAPVFAPPPQDYSEVRGSKPDTAGIVDEWEAIQIADTKKWKEEEERKQRVAEERRKKELEERQQREAEEDKRRKEEEEKKRLQQVEEVKKKAQQAEEDRRKKEEEDKRKKEEDGKRKQAEAEMAKADEKPVEPPAEKKPEPDRKEAEEERKKTELAPATSKDLDKSRLPDPKPDAASSGGRKKVTVTLDHEASGVHNASIPDANNITTTLVVGRLDDDPSGVQWIHDTLDSITHKRIYIVDDPHAPLHLDQNKGREAMVYLQYIIDFYDSLDDVTLFFHSSRSAWHNNVLFNRDAAIMINNLVRSHVLNVGYMNARCELYPGCLEVPGGEGWIKFNPNVFEHRRHEERNADLFNLKLWNELFPDRETDPVYLSEPCCSQFALSKTMIRSVPLAQYRRIHDWLAKTDQMDGYTGRVMEYVWQYLFLKQETYCPDMSACYCDGYGLCLIDDTELREYNNARYQIDATLGKIGDNDAFRGCDKLNKDSPEGSKCRLENPYIDPLIKLRGRKNDLEVRLPKRYGIMEP